MSVVTTSYAREWDAVLWGERATLTASQRATTSSRHPGLVFRGSVYVEVRPITMCPLCGGSRRVGEGPHAPRIVGGGRRVDCVGAEVKP